MVQDVQARVDMKSGEFALNQLRELQTLREVTREVHILPMKAATQQLSEFIGEDLVEIIWRREFRASLEKLAQKLEFH
jgi:hypothetical protein